MHCAKFSGAEKAIRAKWPEAYRVYREEFEKNGLKLGSIIFAEPESGKFIANCMTQDRYGYDGTRYVDYDAIRKVMKTINTLADQGFRVAMPKIGAGLACGDWSVISSIIEEEIKSKVVVYVMTPEEVPYEQKATIPRRVS